MSEQSSGIIPSIEIQIRDAKEVLARIIGFVLNCDSKAGMVLAISGVISLIFTNSRVVSLIISFHEMLSNISELFSTGLTVIIICCGCTFLFGVFNLTCAIAARVAYSGKNSKTYFADISNVDISTYKTEFKNQTQEEILEDLLDTIYVNSCICTKKYRYYNRGLNSIRYTVAFFICMIGFLLSVL